MCLERQKTILRVAAQEKRGRTAREIGEKAASQIADHLVSGFGSQSGCVVSGYLAIGSEIDVLPALCELESCNLKAVLPVVLGEREPLIFRRWGKDLKLEPGPLRTRHPVASSPEMKPDLLIIPLLAFDAEGYRIGWGGGFYDRTLIKLRAEKSVIAVGAAFSSQQVEKVPREGHDARLDWVVTEVGLTHFERLR